MTGRSAPHQVTARDIVELLALAALWGGAFLFMRLGAGDFGPLPLTLLRCSLAALALAPLVMGHGLLPPLRRRWREVAVLGVVNSALPFVAYTFAALSITAGLSAVFNATSPLWAALVAWAWLGERPGRWRSVGLAVGFAGVAWLAWDKASFRPGADGTSTGWAVVACVIATLCYGIGANYAKKKLADVPPLAIAAGSQAGAAVALALPALLSWPAVNPGAAAWGWATVLGVACTGGAYLLYFRLIARIGPARAITVTFLIPLFAVVWGALFLGETLTPVMVGACAVIVAGTALATGLVDPARRRG